MRCVKNISELSSKHLQWVVFLHVVFLLIIPVSFPSSSSAPFVIFDGEETNLRLADEDLLRYEEHLCLVQRFFIGRKFSSF